MNGPFTKIINSTVRTFPCAMKKLKGSLALEAAVALPLFIFFVIAITYFLIIISLQTNIQMGMDEASRSIGKKIYLAEKLEAFYEEEKEKSAEKTVKEIKTESDSDGMPDAEKTKEITDSINADSDTENILTSGINSLSIKAWVLKDNLYSKVKSSRIEGGALGFNTYKSEYDEESGILDIVVNYTYNIPFLPASLSRIRFVQRSRSHAWLGRQISLGPDGSNTDRRTVYITPTGTVYHTSKACPYLDLSIHMTSADEVSGLRNKSGGIYYRCPMCAKDKQPTSVYITDYGTKWHTDINCSGLKRTVIEKDISEVGDMHRCSKCAEGGEE